MAKRYELRVKALWIDWDGCRRESPWSVQFDSRDFGTVTEFLHRVWDWYAINDHDHDAEIFRIKEKPDGSRSEKRIIPWRKLEGK
jgi:hypothetical protein